MYATERQDAITDLLEADGRVAVAQLAQRFEVTAETIRRDLDALEAAGFLRRIHGGAVPLGRSSMAETSLAEREQRGVAGKGRIAAAAAALLPERFAGSLLLDAGTTVGRLADLLAERRCAPNPAAVDVITNSLAIASRLLPVAGLDVRLVGGRLRGITSATVGPETVAALEALRPDVAFVGANGVSAGFGLSTPDASEAAVKAAMARIAQRVVALVDGTKLGAETLHRFAALEALDTLITDTAPDPVLAAALDTAGVDVVVA